MGIRYPRISYFALVLCEFRGFLWFKRFQRGDLKLAALQDDTVRHFDDQNNVQIQFVDEDDFPLASITEHQASDGEFYSGASESRSEDSSEESEEEDSEVESDEENWSREVRRRVDLEFSEEPGINQYKKPEIVFGLFWAVFHTRGMAVVS